MPICHQDVQGLLNQLTKVLLHWIGFGPVCGRSLSPTTSLKAIRIVSLERIQWVYIKRPAQAFARWKLLGEVDQYVTAALSGSVVITDY